MRITNNMMLNNSMSNINGNKVNVNNMNNQMASQKKIQRPSGESGDRDPLPASAQYLKRD